MLNTKKIGYLNQLQGLSAINQLNAGGNTMKLRQVANNVTMLETKDRDILISYETPVAVYDKHQQRFFVTDKKWSATTTKHINSWLSSHDVPKRLQGIDRPQSYFDELLDVEK